MGEARKPICRYPRGAETRQRIVDAAIGIFGREGFDGTSTRDIAAAAEVNTPAIPYYFDSKLGLYHACLDRLTGTVWQTIAPAVAECAQNLATGAAIETLIASLCAVQDGMIDSFLAEPQGQAIRRLMAWEDAGCNDNAASRLIQDRIGDPVYRTFRNVVAAIIARPAQWPEIEMHAFSLMGLSMIFHFSQTRAMDMLNCARLDDEAIARLKRVTCRQLAIALSGLAHGDGDGDAGADPG